uniref:Transcription elongation factor SPT6 n=1 Tax=Lutzomyia longipalpis TaxID=7200 RepID=A0A7G3AZW4_LUTLO
MASFLDSEAEESDQEEELEPHERSKLKRLKAVSESEDEEEDDDNRAVVDDLIDDREIDEDSDGSGSERSHKRKKSDDEDDLDDRLEDEDYDLIEENLGVKVERKRFKRLRRIQDEESDGEDKDENGEQQRQRIAERIFDSDEDEERAAERQHAPVEADHFDEEDEEEESDADDFIVDDDGVPITQRKKTRRPIFGDAILQEGQDIFGVDFDYDEFEKYEDDEYEDEYELDGEGDGEKRPKKQARKKTMRKSIFEIYEPSELQRGHFTDLDIEIRKTDIPERMQLREVPITTVDAEKSTELEAEAEWIYKQAFCREPISKQEVFGADSRDRTRKPPSAIGKIKQALDFMRNQQLEVPFIAFYRKEYVKPELNINDLWKVYKYDAKWCQLISRKKALKELFEKMREYQSDKIMEKPDEPLPDDCRLIKDEDLMRLEMAQTPEELKDVQMHFHLYYSHEIPQMQEAWRAKERERKRQERLEAKRREKEALENGEEPPEVTQIDEDDDVEMPEESLKQAADARPYTMCRKGGVCGMAKKFGLTPEEFAENLRDSYQRHEVEQESTELMELAKQYVNTRFQTPEEVLYAVKYVVARQLSREPLLKKTVREIYFERARISVAPTKKGIKEIDENHPCYTMKFLRNKPVRDLAGEQFLRLAMAEDDKLLEITFSEKLEGNTSVPYLDEIKALYQKDEFAKNVQEWNGVRAECVELALNKMVLPELRKELRSMLIAEAKDCVLKAATRKLCNWIKIAPYTVSFPEEDDYEWDATKGLRIMGIAYVPDQEFSAFCALINPDGEVTDYLRCPNLLKPKISIWEDKRGLKEAELQNIKQFVRNKKPHVIAIGGESYDAKRLKEDIMELMKELQDEEQFPPIAVEIVDNELAKIFANSHKGTGEFREYPNVLRQAVSIARKLRDPLVEYSQLCTADDEILCLRYHPLQDQLPKEELLEGLYLEFINRTNEVGVDINLAVQNPLYVNLVQFICGLGPRKGQALIKILKQTNQRLENRTQLVTACHMGPKVFINCSGFIKIDTNSLGDSTEAYVEVLDGSRVHPETYEWARKMAIDALEYDDDQMNPAGALEEILESPERLKDLDLDAFAVELERQGFGNRSITLYDIRAELNCRYKDLRTPYRSPNPEELFDMLTKETPETFYVGKMVLAVARDFTYRKPQGEQLDQANPTRNDETGLWQCPFCLENEFPELSEVWNHFDAKACRGQATGVKLRLDNGLAGYIHIKNLSDKHVKSPEERVQIGQSVYVRIIKIDVDRFSVDCSSKSSDLLDKNNEWRPTKDSYYDQEAEDQITRKDDDTKKQKARHHYITRVIFHPAFHNKSYTEALKIMEKMDQGEVIIRPSSKGSDHLTVTWKVTDDIYQHIDVREEGKENAFCLGKRLCIGSEEFEDLDEIIARYVNPMASYARDLLNYKYYRGSLLGIRDKAEECLKEEKAKNPNKIHYFVSASKNYPGRFLLSYLPVNKCRHEYVTITPEGFRFRQQIFDSLNALLKWFKEHFKDPLPAGTPLTTPRMSLRTPYGTPGQTSGSNSVNADAITKVAQNMPSHMLHSLSQVANQTPHYPHTPGGYAQTSYVNTPYTPSGQTPFMTPYHTPHSSQTPRYGQTTPTMNGPFVHPGMSASQQPYRSGSVGSGAGGGGYHHGSGAPPMHNPSPRNRYHGSSPFVPSPQSRYGSQNENLEWQRADDAWARSKGTPGQATPRDRSGRGSSRTPRYDEYPQQQQQQHGGPRKTPQYDNGRPMSRSGRSDYGKSPRSSRSSPRTNTSPRSMTIGDSTPLWDEN